MNKYLIRTNAILVLSLLTTVLTTGYMKTSRTDTHLNQAVTSARDSELEKVIEIAPENARALLGLGLLYIYKGAAENALSSLNKGIKLVSENELAVDKSVSSALQRYKFTPQEINRKSYDINDIDYIRRCIKYKETCTNIIKEQETEEDKIFALFDWVYRNMSIATPGEDYAALPLDLMLRGYGCCDRSAWVFTTLAGQAGYHTSIFYLRDPETLVLPHTVALVFLNGKWVVFDTYIGIYFRKQNGELIGLNDIIRKPSVTHHIPKYKEYWSKCFDKGSIWIPVEAESALPRIQLMQEVANEFSANPPTIYHNPWEDLLFSLRTLNAEMPSNRIINLPFKIRNNLADIWFYPFNLRRHYIKGAFRKNVKRCNPALEYYMSARETYLAGNYQQALEEYEKLLEKSPDSDYSDNLFYFRCLCLFELKDWKKTSRQLKGYLQEHPGGKWKQAAIYHLGRCFEEMKLYQEAIEEYRKIEDVPNVSEKLKLLTRSE